MLDEAALPEGASVAATETIEPIEPPIDHECTGDHDEQVRRGEVGADGRGWGPGWPTDNSAKMTTVRAGGVALSVRQELGPLIERLVTETVEGGYVLRHGECWGFANRPIRGTNRPSNHSWGLAVDLNARTNPMTADLVTDMPSSVVELWTANRFRWGGHYRGRKDPMHFEFMGTAADVSGLLSGLGLSVSVPLPAADLRPLLRVGATGPAVRQLQERLNAHGANLVVDGQFGPRTAEAVRAFQQQAGLAVDGIVGPLTWVALG